MMLHATCNNCGVVTATANLDEEESECAGWPFIIHPCCGPSSNPCISIHKGAASADACYANHVSAPLWRTGMSMARASIEYSTRLYENDEHLRGFIPSIESISLFEISEEVSKMLPYDVYPSSDYHSDKSDGVKFINMVDALNSSTRTPAGTNWVGRRNGEGYDIMLIPDKVYGLRDIGPIAEGGPVWLAQRYGLQDADATSMSALRFLNKHVQRPPDSKWGFREGNGFGLYLCRNGKLECV